MGKCIFTGKELDTIFNVEGKEVYADINVLIVYNNVVSATTYDDRLKFYNEFISLQTNKDESYLEFINKLNLGLLYFVNELKPKDTVSVNVVKEKKLAESDDKLAQKTKDTVSADVVKEKELAERDDKLAQETKDTISADVVKEKELAERDDKLAQETKDTLTNNVEKKDESVESNGNNENKTEGVKDFKNNEEEIKTKSDENDSINDVKAISEDQKTLDDEFVKEGSISKDNIHVDKFDNGSAETDIKEQNIYKNIVEPILSTAEKEPVKDEEKKDYSDSKGNGNKDNNEINLSNLISGFNPPVFEFIGRSIAFGFGSMISLFLAVPALQIWFLKWCCNYINIDGKQIQFDAPIGEYYIKNLTWGLLTIVTLGIYGIILPIKVVDWILQHVHFKGVIIKENNIGIKKTTIATITKYLPYVYGLFFIFMICAIAFGADTVRIHYSYYSFWRVRDYDSFVAFSILGFLGTFITSIVGLITAYFANINNQKKDLGNLFYADLCYSVVTIIFIIIYFIVTASSGAI